MEGDNVFFFDPKITFICKLGRPTEIQLLKVRKGDFKTPGRSSIPLDQILFSNDFFFFACKLFRFEVTKKHPEVTKQNHFNFVMIMLYSFVRQIVPSVFSTASRLTNSYYFSGNVLERFAPAIFTVSQALRAWQIFVPDVSGASRLTTFNDFLVRPCPFSSAARLRIFSVSGGSRLRPPMPGLDPVFAPWNF